MKIRFAWFGIAVAFVGFLIALVQKDYKTAWLIAACVSATIVALVFQSRKPHSD